MAFVAELRNLPQDVAIDLIAMMNTFPAIAKDGKVNYRGVNFKYITLDTMLSVIRQHLAQTGNFALVQDVTQDAESVSITPCLVHKTGVVIPGGTVSLYNATSASAQERGAVLTYARRYALACCFGISADEDLDGNLSECIGIVPAQGRQFAQGRGQDVKPVKQVVLNPPKPAETNPKVKQPWTPEQKQELGKAKDLLLQYGKQLNEVMSTFCGAIGRNPFVGGALPTDEEAEKGLNALRKMVEEILEASATEEKEN